jgi:hypothetical protein
MNGVSFTSLMTPLFQFQGNIAVLSVPENCEILPVEPAHSITSTGWISLMHVLVCAVMKDDLSNRGDLFRMTGSLTIDWTRFQSVSSTQLSVN